MEIKDIQRLAELSRLQCSSEELRSYQEAFKGILNYIDTLKTVDISNNIQGASSGNSVVNVVREDDVSYVKGEFSDVLLTAAPHTQDNYVKVKKII